MSASIDIFKLKFSVFGHGFEDTRADSGDGHATRADKINYPASYACIDSTGQYLWLAGGSGIKKYDLLDDDLSEVAQSAVTDGTSTILMHPSNVANNYGIAFQGTTCTIFDLTNNTVIKSGTVAYQLAVSIAYDCFLMGTELRICSLGQVRTTNHIYKLSISDLTMTDNSWAAQGSCGFVADDKIFAYSEPQYFYLYQYIIGINLDATQAWNVQAPRAGGTGFSLINETGWGANGQMWMPCYKYGKWRMGAFNWSASSDFITPKPNKVFGTFPSRPTVIVNVNKYFVAHTDGRDKVAFTTNLGVYLGDYHDLQKITDDVHYVLATDGTMVVAQNPDDNWTYIYR